MIRQDVTRGQRIDDILELWAWQANAGLPTLLELDPAGNAPTHVGWTVLINQHGTCRLAGGDAETFLERDYKGILATIFFCGRAGALALDAITAALGGGRPHVREIRNGGFDFAVAATLFGTKSRELAGVMLVIATDALTLRRLNTSLEIGPSIEVVSRVA